MANRKRYTIKIYESLFRYKIASDPYGIFFTRGVSLHADVVCRCTFSATLSPANIALHRDRYGSDIFLASDAQPGSWKKGGMFHLRMYQSRNGGDSRKTRQSLATHQIIAAIISGMRDSHSTERSPMSFGSAFFASRSPLPLRNFHTIFFHLPVDVVVSEP